MAVLRLCRALVPHFQAPVGLVQARKQPQATSKWWVWPVAAAGGAGEGKMGGCTILPQSSPAPLPMTIFQPAPERPASLSPQPRRGRKQGKVREDEDLAFSVVPRAAHDPERSKKGGTEFVLVPNNPAAESVSAAHAGRRMQGLRLHVLRGEAAPGRRSKDSRIDASAGCNHPRAPILALWQRWPQRRFALPSRPSPRRLCSPA